jgi:hypothetical protein
LQSLDKSIQGQVNKLEELCAKEEKEHKSRIVGMDDDTKVIHSFIEAWIFKPEHKFPSCS